MNDPGDHGAWGLAARLGIFARTFRRETPEEVAAAVAQVKDVAAGGRLMDWPEVFGHLARLPPVR